MLRFGETLKQLRKQKGMTQKQLAGRLGLAISAISSYENGTRYPSYDILIKITAIFHVTADYLLGITTTRTIDVSGLSEENITLVAQLVDNLRQR